MKEEKPRRHWGHRGTRRKNKSSGFQGISDFH